MEKDDGVVWSVCNPFLHAGEIQAFGLFGEVRIGRNRKLNIGEDLIVVGPCWAAEVDGWRPGVEFLEEQSSQMHGSCARNGLD